MNIEKQEQRQAETQWAISKEWFQQNSRSYASLLRQYLCPDCAKKYNNSPKSLDPETIISVIKKCCGRTPGFINERQPILESAFRILLLNGNQPLDLALLGSLLSEMREGDYYRTSPEMLFQLLNNDRYYGLRPVKEDLSQVKT
jgi:hypothetical protein